MPGLKKAVLLGLAVLLALSATGCGRAVVSEQFLEVYQIRSGTVIDIYNQNGNVKITGWDQNTVEIAATKESSRGQTALDEVDILIDIGDRVLIKTEHPDLNSHVRVSYEIKVPEDLFIGLIDCSNGNVSLENITGNPDITTSNGTITANGVNGILTARSSNGNISAVSVKSLGGLETSNGNIEAELPTLYDDLEIKTSNGSITLSLASSLRADFEATTSNGTIAISNLDIETAELEKTSLTGSLNGGGYKVKISTSNGSIELIQLR